MLLIWASFIWRWSLSTFSTGNGLSVIPKLLTLLNSVTKSMLLVFLWCPTHTSLELTWKLLKLTLQVIIWEFLQKYPTSCIPLTWMKTWTWSKHTQCWHSSRQSPRSGDFLYSVKARCQWLDIYQKHLEQYHMVWQCYGFALLCRHDYVLYIIVIIRYLNNCARAWKYHFTWRRQRVLSFQISPTITWLKSLCRADACLHL